MRLVDLILGKRVPAALLADVDQFGIRPPLVEQPLVREIVVDDHVGLFHALQALDRDQAGIARAGAD